LNVTERGWGTLKGTLNGRKKNYLGTGKGVQNKLKFVGYVRFPEKSMNRQNNASKFSSVSKQVQMAEGKVDGVQKGGDEATC